METQEKTFRNYDQSDATAAVREHYKKMRQYQTYDYVRRMKQKYLTYDTPMNLWDAFIKLNDLIDVSDPDLDLPNIQHL
ncbi:MAG TPA: inositol oxygenase family protein, partial [Membranihabitans sp.]|nr:inositol oxygenase family protein [Membranihabitans sp.]